jgi:hypothetical protein
MFDSDGNRVWVPAEKVTQELGNGYQLAHFMTDTDGNTVLVPHDHLKSVLQDGYKVGPASQQGALLGQQQEPKSPYQYDAQAPHFYDPNISNPYPPSTNKDPVSWVQDRAQKSHQQATEDLQRVQWLGEHGYESPTKVGIQTFLSGAQRTASDVLGGAADPKNLAIAAGVAAFPPAAAPAAIYFGSQGAEAALTPRQPGETAPDAAERRLLGAATLPLSVAGAHEGVPATVDAVKSATRAVATPAANMLRSGISNYTPTGTLSDFADLAKRAVVGNTVGRLPGTSLLGDVAKRPTLAEAVDLLKPNPQRNLFNKTPKLGDAPISEATVPQTAEPQAPAAPFNAGRAPGNPTFDLGNAEQTAPSTNPRAIHGESALTQILTAQGEDNLGAIAKSRNVNTVPTPEEYAKILDTAKSWRRQGESMQAAVDRATRAHIMNKIVDSMSPDDLDEIGRRYEANQKFTHNFGDVPPEVMQTLGLKEYFPNVKLTKAAQARTAGAIQKAAPQPATQDIASSPQSMNEAAFNLKKQGIANPTMQQVTERASNLKGYKVEPPVGAEAPVAPKAVNPEATTKGYDQFEQQYKGRIVKETQGPADPKNLLANVGGSEGTSPETIKSIETALRNGQPVEPVKLYLTEKVDPSTGKPTVLGFDGRHRAQAAANVGVKIPVIVRRVR